MIKFKFLLFCYFWLLPNIALAAPRTYNPVGKAIGGLGAMAFFFAASYIVNKIRGK